jgi:hypothetical protein
MTLADDNARLAAENTALVSRIAELEQQLASALARIAELEQQRQDPPSFVKPNRAKSKEAKHPRKKRAPEHNHGRRRQAPTRIDSHALERCPECNYRLHGHSLDYTRQVVWAEALGACYEQAQAWLKQQPKASREEREAAYVTLLASTHALGLQYAKTYEHACCALAKRVLRHEDELFQFVLIEGLSADNNLAERSIRPLVVLRKISGGSRSAEGTKTRMGLVSLFETWQARNLNPFEECLALLCRDATPRAQIPLPQV